MLQTKILYGMKFLLIILFFLVALKNLLQRVTMHNCIIFNVTTVWFLYMRFYTNVSYKQYNVPCRFFNEVISGILLVAIKRIYSCSSSVRLDYYIYTLRYSIFTHFFLLHFFFVFIIYTFQCLAEFSAKKK